MTIHETAAKLSAVNATIAHMAQTSNDECLRLTARIRELEGALREFVDLANNQGQLNLTMIANGARAILAKGD